MDAGDLQARVIHKNPTDLVVRPHLDDYDAVRASFTWEQARGLAGRASRGRA